MSFAQRTLDGIEHTPAAVDATGKVLNFGSDTIEGVQKVALMVWNPLSLAWERGTAQAGGSGGGGSAITKRIDVASDTVMYVGEATPGAIESDTTWTITKNTFDVNGNPTAALIAAGAWTNRVALVYQ
jgi:hypothetical protein